MKSLIESNGGIDIKKIMLTLIFVLLLATACAGKSTSFQGTINSISSEEIKVNCSNEVNKGKKNVDSKGYLCTVKINESTVFKDRSGNVRKLEDFSEGDLVQVTLSKPQRINEKNMIFASSEIMFVQ